MNIKRSYITYFFITLSQVIIKICCCSIICNYDDACFLCTLDNILYTLHFYAATHGQDVRDMVEEVSQKGLPIFVTEYGVTAASGDVPRDLDSADLWIDLLEREGITVISRIAQIGRVCDWGPLNASTAEKDFPVADDEKGAQMRESIAAARAE